MTVKVLHPGLLTSIQDLGRYGYQKYGVIVSGGMDSYSLRLANLLVGNEENEGVLEISLAGPSLKLRKATLFAITGGDLSPTINGEPVPLGRPVYLKQEGILQFGACKSGCRCYLAIAGGFAVPRIMGSKSTYLRAGIGGYQGRALQAGDELALDLPGRRAGKLIEYLVKQPAAKESSFFTTSWYAGREHIPLPGGAVSIRIIAGSQFAQFSELSRQRFLQEEYQITPQADRMGYRLSGPALQLTEPLEMISEAVVLGTVQVPPDGNPIILLADRQTAGGYPKIGQVAAVDIAIVAQIKPGRKICFVKISLNEAEQLYLAREEHLCQLAKAIQLKTQ